MMRLRDLSERASRRLAFQRAQQRLVDDFDRLTREHVSEFPSHGPRVGIATFGSGSWHLALESLLAHALALRGARPELLVCDLPDLPVCDERTSASRSIERCAGCLDDKRALLQACRLPWRGVSAFVAPGALSRARAEVAAIEDDQLRGHTENGWPIGQWLDVSACHYLRRDARGAAPEMIDTRRRLLDSAIVITQAVERWLDDTQPEIVIAESGAHFMWRIAFELARARGIRVVCREIGKGGFDHHLYALNADCMAPDLDRDWQAARARPLNASEEQAVDAFLEGLPARTYDASAVTSPVVRDLRESLGIPADRRIAVAFGNVTWDLATAGRDVAFNGVADWVRTCVAEVGRHPGTHLVVRAHPAEAHVTTRERLADQIRVEFPNAAHVTLIDADRAVEASRLFAIADLVLAYNSTAGLEAAAAGRAAVIAGRPHYRGRGFTIDVSSRQEFADCIERWARDGEPQIAGAFGDLARRYVELFFLRYHLRMNWTTSPLAPPIALTIRSLEDLRPGRNLAVDVVCDGVLAGRQPVMPVEAVVAEPICTP